MFKEISPANRKIYDLLRTLRNTKNVRMRKLSWKNVSYGRDDDIWLSFCVPYIDRDIEICMSSNTGYYSLRLPNAGEALSFKSDSLVGMQIQLFIQPFEKHIEKSIAEFEAEQKKKRERNMRQTMNAADALESMLRKSHQR